MRNSKNCLVSIAATSLNSKSFIKDFMESVLKTDYPNFELVILDDHSTDGTYEWLIKHFGDHPQVKIYRNRTIKRLGWSRTRVFKKTKGKYIALLDCDVKVRSDWLKEHLKVLENDSTIGVSQGKTLDYQKTFLVQTTANYLIPHTGWVICEGLGRPARQDWPKSRECLAGATNVVYRKSILKKTGYFDKKFGCNIDDVDLNWRLWLAGYRQVSTPTAIIYHYTAKERKVRNKTISRVEFEFEYAKMPRIFVKNYEWPNIIRYLPWLFLMYFVRALMNFFKGNPAPMVGLLKGWKWFLGQLGDNLKERKKIQKLRKWRDADLFGRMMLSGSFIYLFKNKLVPSLKTSAKLFKPLKEKKICRLCRKKGPIKKKIRVDKKYSYLICDYCGGGVLFPRPTSAKLKQLHQSKKYFKNLYAPAKNFYIQWLLTRRFHKTPAAWAAAQLKPGIILDVGCGNGEFMSELEKLGFKAYGLELNPTAVKAAADKVGDGRVKKGGFLEMRSKKKFDLISFWHVLEHLDQPLAHIKKAKSLLKSNGIIAGEVPNLNSFSFLFFKENYNWMAAPEHVNYFSKKSLMTLLRLGGFENIKFSYPPRALLNFALSFNKYLTKKSLPALARNSLFLFSIPFSVISAFLLSPLGKGEVLRFMAGGKSNNKI